MIHGPDPEVTIAQIAKSPGASGGPRSPPSISVGSVCVATRYEDQKTRTLSASSASLAASGGVVHCAFATLRSSSVAPRATAQAFQT